MAHPLTLAAIDAGSNAIRVIIAHATSATEFTTLTAERVPVRLGSGTFTSGALNTATIDKAVSAFLRFRRLFDEHEVTTYRAVATSALRNASNREALLDRLFREAEIELEVIDGEEESRLVRKAVLARYPGDAPPEAIVDLGGGSLEVMRHSSEGWANASMKIGTVRLLETFGLKGAISDDERRLLQRFVRTTVRGGLSDEILRGDLPRAAACGGNTEALYELFGHDDENDAHLLPLADLRAALPEIVGFDIKERMEHYEVRKDRAEVMGVAAIVLATLGKELGLEAYEVPGVGIREGILLDLAEASIGKLSRSGEAPTIAAARTFAARVGHNIDHGEQVRMIAQRLFHALQPVHKLPAKCSTILQLAALLHDIGEVVHRKSHHKHSEYLIMQGRIPGLESPMREMVAATARAHRKSLPSERKHEIYAQLDEKQQEQVTKMATLLRLADTLDENRRGQVIAIDADLKPRKVTITISGKEATVPHEQAMLARTAEFEALFERKLVVEDRIVSDGAREHRAS